MRRVNDTGTAKITFHGDLNEFLRTDNSARSLDYPVARRASIKDVIEALGPPHTEVGRILVDGADVDFTHLLKPRERVEVRPVQAPMDVTKPAPLRPDPLPELKFVVDVNVGKLADRLRLLGLDAAYEPEWSDDAIAAIAEAEGRVVLSKDLALLKRNKVEFGRAVRAAHPDDQILEVVEFFGIQGPFEPFTRCIHDNTPLVPVDKADIIDRLEPLTKKYFHEFHICPTCGRIYWPGSHHERMQEWMQNIGLGTGR
jgi:hypothetical protein